jgi:hypothetical protein
MSTTFDPQALLATPTVLWQETFLPGKSAEDVLSTIEYAYGPVGTITTARVPGGLRLVHRYRPTWATVLALLGIFVFLIGLLFFFVKVEDVLMVQVREADGGAYVSVSGKAQSEITGTLGAYLHQQRMATA